jgi:hypothetical protein
LLERYLLVSQLAPQLKHLIELVRPVYGARVSSVLVSGSLPNLRPLSMLLIDELDIEVETLDSMDLLEPNLSTLTETVAGLQLATAAAAEPEPAPFEAAPVPARTRDRGTSTLAVLAVALVAAWSYLQASGTGRVVPALSAQQAAVLAGGTIDTVPSPPVTDLRIESTMGRIGARSAPPLVTSPVAPTSVPAPPPQPVASAPEPPRPRLPRVDGVMISSARSLAIVDGNLVAPGDRIGGRTVVKIDREGVLLREPSGRELHVAIRTRK